MSEKKEFTATQVMVLQEEILHQVKILAENQVSITNDIKGIHTQLERLDPIENDISIIKTTLTQKANLNDFQTLDKRMVCLEKKMA